MPNVPSEVAAVIALVVLIVLMPVGWGLWIARQYAKNIRPGKAAAPVPPLKERILADKGQKFEILPGLWVTLIDVEEVWVNWLVEKAKLVVVLSAEPEISLPDLDFSPASPPQTRWLHDGGLSVEVATGGRSSRSVKFDGGRISSALAERWQVANVSPLFDFRIESAFARIV